MWSYFIARFSSYRGWIGYSLNVASTADAEDRGSGGVPRGANHASVAARRHCSPAVRRVQGALP
jgi:hypothetical protein